MGEQNRIHHKMEHLTFEELGKGSKPDICQCAKCKYHDNNWYDSSKGGWVKRIPPRVRQPKYKIRSRIKFKNGDQGLATITGYDYSKGCYVVRRDRGGPRYV